MTSKQFIILFTPLLLPAFFIQLNAQDPTPVNAPATDSLPGIFEKVEVEASFPGGEQGWREFLEQNLDAAVPVKNRAPAGKYTVMIQFVVNKEGKISNIKPLTHLGFGMEPEVMRILRKSPKWVPAIMNGKPVNAYRRQPVTFMVIEEKRGKKNR